jgi:hypothetical protein
MMHKRPRDVRVEDLQALVDDRQDETQHLEFKGAVDLDDKKQRHEAAKDVSAMANGGGGRIVYGVAEKDDGRGGKIAGEVVGVSDGGFLDRLNRLLASNVKPAVTFTPSPLISVVPGRVCIVVDVEHDPFVLHMVEGYDGKRFYCRVNRDAMPMSQVDIARRYEAIERLRKRAEDRIEEVVAEEMKQLVSEEFPADPQRWLSVVAIPLTGREDAVEAVSIDRAWLGRFPYTNRGYSSRFGELKPCGDGAEFRSSRVGSPSTLVRCRRDGVVHVGTPWFRDDSCWWWVHVAQVILDCGYACWAIAERSGIVGPIRLELVVRNDSEVPVQGRPKSDRYAVLPKGERRYGKTMQGPPDRDVPRAFKGLMDWLYQLGGEKDCPWIDGTGDVGAGFVREIWR